MNYQFKYLKKKLYYQQKISTIIQKSNQINLTQLCNLKTFSYTSEMYQIIKKQLNYKREDSFDFTVLKINIKFYQQLFKEKVFRSQRENGAPQYQNMYSLIKYKMNLKFLFIQIFY
ncbi:hypothetical protein pb186bvf_016504 [Paramecium bursaria]